MPANEKERYQAELIMLAIRRVLEKETGGRARYGYLKSHAKHVLTNKSLFPKQLSKGLKDLQSTGEVRVQRIWSNGTRPTSIYSLTGKRLLAVSNVIPDTDMKEPKIVRQTVHDYGIRGRRVSRTRKVAVPSD